MRAESYALGGGAVNLSRWSYRAAFTTLRY